MTTTVKLPSNYPLEYPYKYPMFRRVKLAAVKDGIFHPRPPTLRKIAMDTESQKLPDEHAQTSTFYGSEGYKDALKGISTRRCLAMQFVPQSPRNLMPLQIPPDDALPDANKLMFNISPEQWKRYVDTDKRFRLPTYDPKYFRFKHHVIRYVQEDMTRPTPFYFRQEPNLEGYNQRPTPANIHRRHRQLSPQFKRNHISTLPWY